MKHPKVVGSQDLPSVCITVTAITANYCITFKNYFPQKNHHQKHQQHYSDRIGFLSDMQVTKFKNQTNNYYFTPKKDGQKFISDKLTKAKFSSKDFSSC